MGDTCHEGHDHHAKALITTEERLALSLKAKRLAWFSLFAISLEGSVALFAGIVAGSIALIGFGIDSVIEGLASLVIVWRFSGYRILSHASEEKAQKLVAIQFFILAPYVAYESIQALLYMEKPSISVLGMALTLGSLIVMPILGQMKIRIAKQLDSNALHGEGRQNMLCTYMAAAVFIGLAGNALFGAWWLDPVIGLVISGMAIQEGRLAWRGEACC